MSIAACLGAVWGGVRGLQYLPTFPIAIIEGAVIFGIPVALVGLAVVGLVSVTAKFSQHQ